VRIGIVGCGKQGVNGHGRNFRALRDQGVEVVGAADPTPARLEIAGKELELEPGQLHLDPLELIRRPDVDAITVTSPQRFHPDLVIAAAAAGKHVLCEKPIANAPADAARMVAACREAGVVLAMCHNYLWMHDGLKEVVDSGEIGRPLVVTLNALGVIDHPGSGEYRPTWRHTLAEAGGGVLTDMLHYVYLVPHLLGASISRVSASVDRRLSDDQDVEDTALCRFGHGEPGGPIVGHSTVNVAWGEGPGGLEVMGDRGRASVRYKDGGTLPFAQAERIEIVGRDGAREIAPSPREGRRVYLDFVEAVRDGRPPAATGEAGLKALEATVAVYGSAALGREVALPLPTDSPLYLKGAAGIAELDLPSDSPVRRLGLFGVARSQ
jgi:predicted dehydrogenase